MSDFQKIDDGWGADKPLSAPLAQDLAQSGQACLDEVHQANTLAFDFRNHPRLCCLKRGVVPFVVYLPGGTKTIKVKPFGKADGTDGGTLGAVVAPLSWLDRPVPDNGTTVVVSSSTEAKQTLTIQSDSFNGAGGGWALVWLTWESSAGTAVPIEPQAGGSDDGHLTQIARTILEFGAASSRFDDEIPCAAVDVRTYDDGAGETNADATWRDGNLSLRQVLIATDDTLSGSLHFYPPIARSYVPRSTATGDLVDVAFWTPLGYFDLYSVEIEVTAVEAAPALGTAYNATQEPRASAARRIYADAVRAFGERGRWHRTGPQPDPTKTDTSDSAKGGWFSTTTPPINPISDHIKLTGSGWTTIQEVMVGQDDLYTDIDDTAKRRTGLQTRALVVLQGYGEGYRRRNGRTDTRDLGALRFEVETRLEWVTAGTLAGSKEGDGGNGQVIPALPFVRDAPAESPLGYLLGLSSFDDQQRYTTALRLHALRGVVHADSWGELPWAVLATDGKDDNVAAVDARLARLQLNQVDRDYDRAEPAASTGNTPARYMHIFAWGVVSTPGIDGDIIGEA